MTEKGNPLDTPYSNDPTDGREKHSWKSHYPDEAKKQIRCESIYLAGMFVLSFVLILSVWHGALAAVFSSLTPDRVTVFRKYAFYSVAGMLGGSVFGIKFFYRVVARGYWHQDRRIWRVMSPFLGMGLAFIVGSMLECGVLRLEKLASTPGIVSIGFLVGYCADTASAKMIDVANALFGLKEK